MSGTDSSSADDPRCGSTPHGEERAGLEALRLQTAGELASGVAHEVNNVLATIYVACTALRKAVADDDEAKASLHLIEEAANHARDVVRSLMRFTRSVASAPGRIHLQELVDQSVALLRPVLRTSTDLRVDCAAAPALWLSGDRGQLQQMLFTLALHRRDAMPKGGTLRISVDPAGDPDAAEGGKVFARLRIEDMAPATPKQTSARRFEPGGAREYGCSTQSSLAIARAIVLRHGGRVTVQSGLEGGTRIDVLLPCDDVSRDTDV